MRKNIIEITNHDRPINTNHIPACCKMLNPALYFSSSPAAVTIWKPPYNNIINVIIPRIPNIQLMKFFTTWSKFSP